MSLSITFEYDDAAFERLEEALSDGAEEIVSEAASRTAFTARREHGYRNRTGTMERQTFHTPTAGTFFSDNLEAKAVGFTSYASFLERSARFAFLRPAWRMVEPQLRFVAERALSTRLRAAGW